MPVRFQMWFNDPVGQHMCSCMRLYGNEITMGMLVLSFVLYWVAVNISGWIPVATLFPEKAVVEIIWTLIPTIILTVMGFPSIILLFKTHEPVDPALSVKVIGHQWHWAYEYGDFRNILVESYMTRDEDLKLGEVRLLTVDARPVFPTSVPIRVITTSADVIHSWSLWSHYIKIDAIPGRLNRIFTKFDGPGIEYGICSEICGIGHAFMPIVVERVPMCEFLAWAELKESLLLPEPPVEPSFDFPYSARDLLEDLLLGCPLSLIEVYLEALFRLLAEEEMRPKVVNLEAELREFKEYLLEYGYE